MAWRVKRFLRGHCPNQKMSCIGKYKRNVINFQQTTHWMLFWHLSILLDIPCQAFLERNQSLSPEYKFLIWNVKGAVLNECFLLVQLAIKVPDTRKKNIPSCRFYVRSPTLEPRRFTLEPGGTIFEPKKLSPKRSELKFVPKVKRIFVEPYPGSSGSHWCWQSRERWSNNQTESIDEYTRHRLTHRHRQVNEEKYK